MIVSLPQKAKYVMVLPQTSHFPSTLELVKTIPLKTFLGGENGGGVVS